jgi:hypothetical protein
MLRLQRRAMAAPATVLPAPREHRPAAAPVNTPPVTRRAAFMLSIATVQPTARSFCQFRCAEGWGWRFERGRRGRPREGPGRRRRTTAGPAVLFRGAFGAAGRCSPVGQHPVLERLAAGQLNVPVPPDAGQIHRLLVGLECPRLSRMGGGSQHHLRSPMATRSDLVLEALRPARGADPRFRSVVLLSTVRPNPGRLLLGRIRRHVECQLLLRRSLGVGSFPITIGMRFFALAVAAGLRVGREAWYLLVHVKPASTPSRDSVRVGGRRKELMVGSDAGAGRS